jgi:DNA (cytosine-5)-methyltransferase 1
MLSDPLPILSLFCGAGGLDWGFRREGFRIALACDNFKAAVNSYNRNAKKKVARIADLSTMTSRHLVTLLEETDPGTRPIGILGGPPCQGFSRGNASADPEDPRNLLPFRYADILTALNRKYGLRFFVFENVMGLLNPRHAARFKAIRERFEAAGFTVFQETLNASAFGVPQNRPRLFVVGLNSELFPSATFTFPKGRAKPMKVCDVIAGLPQPAFFRRGMTEEEIPYHPNHWTMMPKSAKLTTDTQTDGRSFRRLLWDEESPTIAYGNREIHVHPDGGRRLSVHEAMLLQGFPARYRLTGNFSEQVTQVSNAVPPPVARALAQRIRRAIMSQGVVVREAGTRNAARQAPCEVKANGC